MDFAYSRVSSDQQDVESQRLEVQRYADQNGLQVTDWIELGMFAAKNGFKKRRILELLNLIKPGDTLEAQIMHSLYGSRKHF